MTDRQVFRRFASRLVLGLAALLLTTGAAHAAVITFTATGTFDHTVGTDVLGLDDATFTFEAAFDADATYADRFGLPSVAALTSSLTIANASVASVDGTYTAGDPVVFYPTFQGQFFGGSSGGGNIEWSVGGLDLFLAALVEPTALGVLVGDQVDASHFGTSLSASSAEFFTGGGDRWAIGSLSVRVTTIPDSVPEPTSLALLGVGLASLVIARRRRSPQV